MDTMFFIVFLALIVFSSVYGYFEFAKLRNRIPTEKGRIRLYKKTIIEGWLMVVFVLVFSAVQGISLKAMGIAIPKDSFFDVSTLVKSIVFIGCGLFFLQLMYQIIGYLTSEAFRIQLEKQVAKSQAKDSRLNNALYNIIIPSTYREKVWFTVVSATAGIGEEIVFRGFLMYHLMRQFPECPLAIIVISAGVVFGFAHLYQGFSGIIKTSLLGIAFGALYISFGSLLPGMIFHFTIDVSVNFLKPSVKGDAYIKA